MYINYNFSVFFSPLQLSLNEHFAEMSLHDLDDCSTFLSLLHLPTKPPGDYINLSDIHSNSSALCKQHVNLLVAVRSVSNSRPMNVLCFYY